MAGNCSPSSRIIFQFKMHRAHGFFPPSFTNIPFNGFVNASFISFSFAVKHECGWDLMFIAIEHWLDMNLWFANTNAIDVGAVHLRMFDGEREIKDVFIWKDSLNIMLAACCLILCSVSVFPSEYVKRCFDDIFYKCLLRIHWLCMRVCQWF